MDPYTNNASEGSVQSFTHKIFIAIRDDLLLSFPFNKNSVILHLNLDPIFRYTRSIANHHELGRSLPVERMDKFSTSMKSKHMWYLSFPVSSLQAQSMQKWILLFQSWLGSSTVGDIVIVKEGIRCKVQKRHLCAILRVWETIIPIILLQKDQKYADTANPFRSASTSRSQYYISLSLFIDTIFQHQRERDPDVPLWWSCKQ